MRQVFLSHPLALDIPVYGGRAQPGLSQVRALASGDSCNVFRMEIGNHWGTHLDGPNHFFSDGVGIAEIPPENLVFFYPYIADVVLTEGEILGVTDAVRAVPEDADILLLRSGWSQFRDEEKYVLRNPGLSPEVGRFLREKRPSVRMVGMDWISASSFSHRETGRAAHREFLSPAGNGGPILLLEDMLIPADIKKLARLTVAPLRFEGIDSAPCTVIGQVDD